ncbi:MAG TPA: hypothetical protein VMH35_28990 [Streptosporangiaceae bacterium]|nr:hypothetical protein [Streptosporangiaceae bacterium]
MSPGPDQPAALVGDVERVADQNRGPGRARARWAVHLALLITVVVALVPLLLFHVSPRVTVHVVIACVFFGLVTVHLAQRRHTLSRLAFSVQPGVPRLPHRPRHSPPEAATTVADPLTPAGATIRAWPWVPAYLPVATVRYSSRS